MCITVPLYGEIGGWFVASIFFRHPVFGTLPEHLQARKKYYSYTAQHSPKKIGKTTD